MDFEKFIANVPDFPKPGIQFKDITPLLGNSEAFDEVTTLLADYCKNKGANVVVGPESRGFIFGCPTAIKANASFVPVRKPGKLPREVISETYLTEYSTDTLEMHKDAIKAGDKVVIVDDLIATGGTLKAIVNMIEKCGATVVGVATLIELVDLKGKDLLGDIEVYSLIKY